MEKISRFFHNLLSGCASLSPRAIALVVLILIATASVAIVGVRASQIYSLAVSSTDGFDVSEADVKVTGEFPSAITFMPVVQAFAGASFGLEGTTSLPPQTASVSTAGFDFGLTDSLLEEGWAFSQVYEDENISTALIEDEEGNKVVVATTEQDDPSQLLSDIEDQYSDILPLLGFEVISSAFEADSMELVFSQENLTLEAQAWIALEEPDKLYVAVLTTTGELPPDLDEIVALLPQ